MLGCFLSLHQVAGPADVWVDGVATGPKPNQSSDFRQSGHGAAYLLGTRARTSSWSTVCQSGRLPASRARRLEATPEIQQSKLHTGKDGRDPCTVPPCEVRDVAPRALRPANAGCPQHGRDPPAEAAPSIPPTGQPAGQAGGGWFQVMLLKILYGSCCACRPSRVIRFLENGGLERSS
jgi:hypothetical protein